MINYEEMSDHEINMAVTCIVYKCHGWSVNASNMGFHHCGFDGSEFHEVECVDYCNNPNDAWPIIVESGISLTFMDAKIKYYEAHGLNKNISDEDWHSSHPKPLRAAMICFLKMKESEQ